MSVMAPYMSHNINSLFLSLKLNSAEKQVNIGKSGAKV
ncbi:hypothetical protein PRUB_b0753 [Pseudoalteromonas rubra]|uniref:Uncharacterized protein n=1 Tax=Pseudoalteromonas rubra TaxID=43658 RepID=A0A8T0C2Q0_9GAMM|nr:hypothetical protein PRUB_b0753 [Pseudoalteromonas rubra]